ncbi:hypothetical protein [Micromonospora sp. S-DT3-3-22]|uniref:hypothetical protein n=1 Tax=Micromonospora sp. S-DT3-3-22 TaxID=2755359 RepID=UPI00189071AF|nr:hypothetical protein [Micromonospora sp. S-DT3-3-22]
MVRIPRPDHQPRQDLRPDRRVRVSRPHAKAHRLHAPDHELVVVFDGEHAAARRATAVPGYKANRARADHTPITALPDVKRALDAAAVHWTETDEIEGDDIIATATTSAVQAGRSVVCYSSDRDFYQLLRPAVTVLTPHRTVITAAEIHRRYRIHPRQWPDYRALTGDPADNIPGTAVGGQWEFPSGGHLAGSYLAAGGDSVFPDGSLFLIGPGGS